MDRWKKKHLQQITQKYEALQYQLTVQASWAMVSNIPNRAFSPILLFFILFCNAQETLKNIRFLCI